MADYVTFSGHSVLSDALSPNDHSITTESGVGKDQVAAFLAD
jgi:hypothetical protein